MALNLKPLLLTPLSLLPIWAGQVEAADLPVKARIPVADPYSPLWAGWYGGVHLGALGERSRQTGYLPTAAQTPFPYCWTSDLCRFRNTQKANGVLGGLQLGYNFQNNQFVYGFETDISVSS